MIHLTLARPHRHVLRRWAACLVLAFGLGLALGLLPSGRVARACSCLPPPPPLQALEAAAAVFDGTVIRVEVVNPAVSYSPLRVTFVVHTQWKGVTTGAIDVTTAGDGAMCGYYFRLGQRYVVYANGGLAGMEVSLCSRTNVYSAEEATALGPDEPPPGAVPATAWQQEPPAAGCPRCMAPPPPRQALAEAAAVFHGQLMGLTFLGPEHDFDHVATFRNLGWWKGPDAPTIDVRVPWNVWFCEGQLGGAGGVQEWGEFLVYADADDDGTLSLALCGRTKAYDADEAAELGAANPPGPEQPTGTPVATDTPTPEPPATFTPDPCPTVECPPCAGPRPAGDWLAESDAVFYGRVLDIELADCDRWVYFNVLETWKGPLADRMRVFVSAASWHCTRSFALDEEAVVFARSDGVSSLTIPLCFGIVDGDPRDELGPGTPVPTATLTATASATPTRPGVTCTPPPCPCGRLVGECPNIHCEVCTATPTPEPGSPVFLPWAVRGGSGQG